MSDRKQEYEDLSFQSFVESEIEDELDEMAGWHNEVYGSELAMKLFEGENVDGSYWCSAYDAKEFIQHYWDEAGEYHEYMKDNFGEVLHNPFEEPESFQVGMIIQKAEEILADCAFIQANWNNEFELNPATVAIIEDDMGLDPGFTEEQLGCLRELWVERGCETANLFANRDMDAVTMQEISDLLDTELEYDNTYPAGISFTGETLESYLLDADANFASMNDLNALLKESGIKPVAASQNADEKSATPSLASESRDARAASGELSNTDNNSISQER